MASNIQRYMEHRLAFPAHNIQEVCADLYMGHGTTLAGLVVRFHRRDPSYLLDKPRRIHQQDPGGAGALGQIPKGHSCRDGGEMSALQGCLTDG